MNRCKFSALMATPLLVAAATCAAQTAAPTVQSPIAIASAGHRNFPSNVEYGVLRISQMPTVQINGQPIRTAPGFRLFNADNKLIFAHTVQGQDLKVAYVKEVSTQWLLTTWILTPEEIQLIPAKR